ncbi:MAG TPA: FtsX-like permease family protein [Pyrinomonadaceae bacterium]|nr:FtsX-like permease family protein [Pyrinomonadaceae bacterium]
MQTASLLKRGLAYYWQTNLVVVLGVAIAVAVLAGALLIGASVRGSLRDLVSQRLGNTDQIVVSPGFFREQLATDLGGAPLIALEGVVTHEASHRRAGGVKVYGVDERFWQFNGKPGIELENRQALISEGLASELGSQSGDSLLLRIEKYSDIPIESLHGRKDDPGKTIRLNVNRSLPRESLGEFSLQPTQGVVRAVFVPLRFLQRELEQETKINTILIASSSPVDLRNKASLEDLGLKLRTAGDSLSLESNSNLIGDSVANAANQSAQALSLKTLPIFSYLANSISAGDRSIPYSLVTALDDDETSKPSGTIVLNEWAARELNAQPGQTISLEYYIWHEGGRLETRKADFQLAGVVKIGGLAADRDLVPDYPGITESESLADWDPPFPVDLSRVRKQDEDYWDQYRTTPKAFISLADGQKLWQSRFGNLTSIRISGPLSPEVVNNYQELLRKALQPTATALQVVPVRTQGMAASRGATDFGEYFLYFSFFLVVSALLLTALFFKLGIEQRLREIGTLQAVGFSASRIRNLFLAEGLLLAIIGSLLGLLGAIGYAALLMYGLRTWWVDAVGTTSLTLHITWPSLVLGAAGGIAAAVGCIFLTLRRIGRSSTRSLLTGTTDDTDMIRAARAYVFVIAVATALIGVALLLAGGLNLIPQVAGFFGGGVLLLVSGVCFLSVWLRRTHRSIKSSGWWAMWQLGFRNTTYRPARTVLCVTLIASAAFIIVAVDAFRRSGAAAHDKNSGTGGFPIVAESLLPIVHDPNTLEGREALNLNNTNENELLKDVRVVSLRLRPGDDASCLNLYQPRNPKIVAPPDSFISENRFAFNNSLEETDNPWALLNKEFPDGAIPVIGDANSLSYVLHLKVGEDFVLDHGPTPVKLRVVAALADSIFQSELIMSDKNFVRLFPAEQGYRYFLIDAPNKTDAATVLEDRLSDFGFDAESTEERLANFHRVENTYLSTFQLLGALGLALGTLGMAAVLLRNVLERRRELALMRAVGYNSSHFAVMVITENVLMLSLGLAVGFVCALLSIAPVLVERGGKAPNISLGLLLLAILISGGAASLVATIAALRSPLLPALRSE